MVIPVSFEYVSVTLDSSTTNGTLSYTVNGITYSSAGTNRFEVEYGASIEITATPVDKYGMYSYTVDGNTVYTTKGSYTGSLTTARKIALENITGEVVVGARFEPVVSIQYEVVGESESMIDKQMLLATTDNGESMAYEYEKTTLKAKVFWTETMLITLGGGTKLTNTAGYVIKEVRYGEAGNILSKTTSSLSEAPITRLIKELGEFNISKEYEVEYLTSKVIKVVEKEEIENVTYEVEVDENNQVELDGNRYIVENEEVTLKVSGVKNL